MNPWIVGGLLTLGLLKRDTARVGETKKRRRNKEVILEDPQASASEIEAVSKKDPLAALRHPNCPVQLWWNLAKKYPIEAQFSPAFPLMAFDPYEWISFEERNAMDWAIDAIHKRKKKAYTLSCISLYMVMVLKVLASLDKSLSSVFADPINIISKFIANKSLSDNDKRSLFSASGKIRDAIKSSAMRKLTADEGTSIIDLFSLVEDTSEAIACMGTSRESVTNIFYNYYCEHPYSTGSYINRLNKGILPLFMASGKFGDKEDATQAARAELNRLQVEFWRLISNSLQLDAIRVSVKQQLADKFREEFYGPEADKAWAAREAVEKKMAEIGDPVKEIVAIMNKPMSKYRWPTWGELGIAAGTVVLVVAAPVLLSALGVTGIAAGVAAETAAVLAADAIAEVAIEAGVTGVSVNVAELAAKYSAAGATDFLAELAAKLAEDGIEVVSEAVVDAVVPVGR